MGSTLMTEIIFAAARRFFLSSIQALTVNIVLLFVLTMAALLCPKKLFATRTLDKTGGGLKVTSPVPLKYGNKSKCFILFHLPVYQKNCVAKVLTFSDFFLRTTDSPKLIFQTTRLTNSHATVVTESISFLLAKLFRSSTKCSSKWVLAILRKQKNVSQVYSLLVGYLSLFCYHFSILCVF